MQDAYADFKSSDDSNFKTVLRQLADEFEQAQAEVDLAAEVLSVKQGILKDLEENRIPDATQGMEGVFDLGDGRKLELKEYIRGSIAGEKAAPAIKWIDENGYGHIVKRQLVFEFDKDSMGKYEDFVDYVKDYVTKKNVVMQPKFNVHPQTLMAWMREMLSNGEQFPKEVFGFYHQRKAKVK